MRIGKDRHKGVGKEGRREAEREQREEGEIREI